MNIFVYAVLFILFTPRLFFNLTKSRSTNVTLKETIAYAAVFTFSIIVVQYISKRYGILEGFAENTQVMTADARQITAAAGTPAGTETKAKGETKAGPAQQLANMRVIDICQQLNSTGMLNATGPRIGGAVSTGTERAVSVGANNANRAQTGTGRTPPVVAKIATGRRS